VSDVIETLSVSDVIDDDDTVGVAIVTVGDGAETFLTGSVPLDEGRGTRTRRTRSPSQVTILFF
jgi:hypothetical protein